VRVLIVDDEAAARRRLAALIEEVGEADLEIVGEASSGLEALDLTRDRRPDVVLLDIAMPEVDGFDVARHLPSPRPLVIFQTAYHEYALQAFEHEALDYVVKPVTRERLAQALERARGRLAERRPPDGIDSGTLERLGTALGYQPARPARILVRHAAGHRLVPVREILRFRADEGLVYADASAGSAATDYTLNELEARMRGTFVRVSRAELVSVAYVQGIASNGDGSATLTLTGGTTVHVARRRAAAVREALQRPFSG
jgi:DNA-binding LytR/AlgR family response regulator